MNNNDIPNDSMIRSNEGGVSRFETIDGQETLSHSGVERWEESERAEIARRGGDSTFLITTQSGRVVQPGAGVTDDMLVRLPGGMQTTIAVALMQGLVSRSADGSIHMDEHEIISKHSAPPRQEQRQQPVVEQFADTGAEGLLRAVENTVNQSDHVAVVRELSDTGTVSPGTIGRIASQMQVTPAEAGQYGSKIVQAFTQQAHASIKSVVGSAIDSNDVIAWAQTNAPKELREALESQYRNRSTKAYKDITTKYVLGLEKSDPAGVMQIAREAGLEARHEKSAGVVVLTFPDNTSMTWAQALQIGKINLSGKGR